MRIAPVLILLSLVLFCGLLCGCTGFTSPDTNQTSVFASASKDFSKPIKISKPGYYRLTSDIIPWGDGELSVLSNSSLSCIRISSSDVTLDGMGHTIDGIHVTKIRKATSDVNSYSVTSSGIIITGRQENDPAYNVIIKNITVKDWYWGIQVSNVKESEVRNIVTINNSDGVHLFRTSGIVIRDSTFTHDGHYGIEGTDVEKTSVLNNTIQNLGFAGIQIDGKMQGGIYQIIDGRVYSVPGIYYDQSKTSGNDQVISGNSVSDSNNGIWVSDTNSNRIVSNTLTNTSRGIVLYNCGQDRVIENNTFFLTKKEISLDNYAQPLTVFLGIIVLLFLKVFANAINIIGDFLIKPLKGTFLFKPETPEGPDGKPASPVFCWQLPAILRNNLVESVAGAIILGGAFTYAQYGKIDLFAFGMLTLIAGIVFVTHEFMHFFMAQRMGLRADFRIWGVGVIITLLSAGIFRDVFGQTVLTTIKDEKNTDPKKIAIVMLAGPVASLFLSSGFYVLYFMQGRYASFAMFGFQMCLMTAFVSFLPIATLEGGRVYKWNKLAWAAAFVPVYLIYGYFFIYQDVLVLFIPVVIGAFGFGLWQLRGYVREKQLRSHRMYVWVKYLIMSVLVLTFARLVNYLVADYHNYSVPIIGSGGLINNLVLLTTILWQLCSLVIMVISIGALLVGFFKEIIRR
jgi:parallel beta-helix repeat protein